MFFFEKGCCNRLIEWKEMHKKALEENSENSVQHLAKTASNVCFF